MELHLAPFVVCTSNKVPQYETHFGQFPLHGQSSLKITFIAATFLSKHIHKSARLGDAVVVKLDEFEYITG